MNTTPERKRNAHWQTPRRSSTSVKVFWLDRSRLMERLNRVARTLGDRHPEIESIYLFGSLARGDAVPGSDADLLIVVSHSVDAFRDRPARYQTTGVGVGVDEVVYTREELDALLETGNEFARRAMREGVRLFPVR